MQRRGDTGNTFEREFIESLTTKVTWSTSTAARSFGAPGALVARSLGDMPQPRPLAVAVIRHPRTGAIFVDETTEPGTGRVHHRAVGGGIEFGELAAQTLVRELSEEYGLQITVGAQLGVLESLFVYDGRAGHELVLVHEAEFASSGDYEVERIPCHDVANTVGTWRPREGSPYPLYPEGLDNLMPES